MSSVVTSPIQVFKRRKAKEKNLVVERDIGISWCETRFHCQVQKYSVSEQKYIEIGSDLLVSHLNDIVLLLNSRMEGRDSFHYEIWDIF